MAPKYWKESITPDANPAILRPPKSIAAAVPMIECVELHVREMIVSRIHATIGPPSDVWPRIQAVTTMEIVSSKYSSAATGARLPRKSVSEMTPELKDPTNADSGSVQTSMAKYLLDLSA